MHMLSCAVIIDNDGTVTYRMLGKWTHTTNVAF